MPPYGCSMKQAAHHNIEGDVLAALPVPCEVLQGAPPSSWGVLARAQGERLGLDTL